jgi:excisionase family DNA binding protein
VGDTLTPKQVAQAIGVSEASLKRWCDKGLVRAVRTAGGHRRLALEDVLEFLRRTGRRPVEAELLQLPSIRSATTPKFDEAVEHLAGALIDGNEELARRIVFDLYLARTSICDLGDRLFAESMRRVGEKWSCRDVEPFQERRACEICGRILSQLRRMLPDPPKSAPRAIGATLSGDAYRLPSALVELTLRELGWRAESLGTGLPADTLCVAIERLRPRLFWLSVSFVESVPGFLEQYQRLYECAQQSKARLVVGGRALDAELRRQMQYHAYCDNLRHLVNFVAQFSSDR